MKVQQTQIDNERVIQIFISKDESETEENMKTIEEIKKENKKVVIFLSGDKDPKRILLSMVQAMKENTT